MRKFWLHFFFSPRGFGMRLGSALCFWGGLMILWKYGPSYQAFAFFGLFVFYLLLRGFTWFRWYPAQTPRAGIEDHFDKVSVLAVWLLLLAGFVSAFLGHPFLAFLSMIPLGFFVTVNFILVAFHLRDADVTAPNALSGESRVF